MAEAEAQRQHAERTQAVFAETGFAEGVRVQVDGAGFGTVIGVTTGLQIRVRVGRHMRDFPRDQLRVVASDDAAPASPATPPSDELAAPVPAPMPDDALDATAAPAPVTPQPCADQVDELAALVQSIQVRGGAPPGYESEVARALELLLVVDAAARAGAAPLRQVHAPPAALPSPAADLDAPPAARPHAVETPPAPAPMAMELARPASPKPIDDEDPAASPVAATAVAPTRLAAAASQPSTTATPAPAPNPMIIRISKPESLRRKPRRSARQTPRLAAPAATAPPARKRRRVPARAPAPSPSVASPEPAASDASAPAARPAKKPRRDWTTEEDDRLLAARKDGLTAWKAIAERVGGSRRDTDCQNRWANHLDPTIKKGPFTAKEEAHLLALSESDLPRGPRGIDWERVATGLPTVDGRRRKGADVKNRYNVLKARKPPATPMSL